MDERQGRAAERRSSLMPTIFPKREAPNHWTAAAGRESFCDDNDVTVEDHDGTHTLTNTEIQL